jgi:hypothetical protein
MTIAERIAKLAAAKPDMNQGFGNIAPIEKAQLSVALCKYNAENPYPIYIRSFPHGNLEAPTGYAVVRVSAPLA